MSNRQPPSNDELEVSEAKNPLVDLLYDYSAQAVTTQVGNYVYHRIDSYLSVVEKTAKWSLPQPPPSEQDTGKTTISAPPLVRPLPWIFFLPALIALRLLRYALSFVALLIGKQPIYPVTMVSFLQNRRRKLRALKYHGLKLQRMRRAEKESKQAADQTKQFTWLRRVTLPLQYIVCFRAVRPGTTISQQDHHAHYHHRHHHQRPSGPARKLTDEPATDGSQRAEPRDRSATNKRNAHERDTDGSDSSLNEATFQELLDKYASAEDDSSFHPSDVSSSDSNSDILESDKSRTEAAEECSEKNQQKKVRKESNGHAASHGKAAQPKAQKSSLNVSENNDKPEGKPAEPAPENGNADSTKDPNEDTPKPAAAEGESNESKPAHPSHPGEEQPPEEGSSKNNNQNASGKQSPPSVKEVKSNVQPRNRQQQQQQQQHQPNQQQQQHHQQQQHQTAVNGAGGGGGAGRKNKRPHHHNAQHF